MLTVDQTKGVVLLAFSYGKGKATAVDNAEYDVERALESINRNLDSISYAEFKRICRKVVELNDVLNS